MSAETPARDGSNGPSRRDALAATAVAISGIAAKTVRADVRRSLPQLVDRTVAVETDQKRQAKRDYQESLSRFGGRLSDNPQRLFETSCRPEQDQFDIIVIGSGYGASICAARLAAKLRPGRRLAMLERGREWIPGEFKDTFMGQVAESRNQLVGPKRRTTLNPLGLHNVIMNDEVNVWTGSGLGGGSLVNANVVLKPDPEVFSKFKWPAALSQIDILEPYFARAAKGLNLSQTPVDLTSKVRSRRLAAQKRHTYEGFYDRSPLAVTYDRQHLAPDGRNPQGMIQRPCKLCGDCITGCNVGAKNTLVTNFLPVAKSHGAEIYTQFEVEAVEKCDGFYRLHLIYYDDDTRPITCRRTTVTSRMVILGAGSPGSPELLLKSRDRGLSLSPALGHRWSGNGDTVGFVVNKNCTNHIGGFGAHSTGDCPVGPTVQTSLHYHHRARLEDRIVIQDAAIPRSSVGLFARLLHDPELDSSAVMLGMGHDGAIGRIELQNGHATIRWPGLKEAPFRRMIWEEFERLAEAEGGRYKRLRAFGDNLVTVHPLGGAAAADDPIEGVVDDLGQVFDGASGGMRDKKTGKPAVHDGLYVADGSIIPSSLGVNPLLTICALSERIVESMLREQKYHDLFSA